MKEEIVRMENVTRIIDGITFLDNIHLHIFKGEIMGLISLNAFGKSQFIELLCQNLPINYGRIYFDGKLVNNYEHSDMNLNKVYIIEQKSKLVQDLTVSDNIFVLRWGFRQYFINRKVLDAQVKRIFSELDIDIPSDRLIKDLPPLERCIVELIRAIIAGCELIIISDLSNFLSPIELEQFQKLIRHYKNRKISFLYVGNHHEEVFALSDRVLLMDNGKIVKVFDKYNMTDENIRQYIISFDLSESKLSRPGKSSILEFNNVYTDNLIDAHFSIKKGECVVIMDLNNKVQQDIVMLMQGEISCYSGEVIWDGKPFTRNDGKKFLAQGIGFINSDPIQMNLYKDFSYIENLCFLMDNKVGRGMHKSILRSVIQEYEKMAGPDIYAKDISKLSQKSLYTLTYLRMHLFNPKIVFCIQPFSWADMYLRRHVLDMIQMLKNKGITVVMLVVNLSDSLDVADRLLIIEKGQVIKEYLEDDFEQFKEKL